MLYLQVSKFKASPKAISGRTSYLQVRLEFLRYPQVIPTFFKIWVRASTKFYFSFTLLMDRSLGFGSTSHNLFALFRLGFPTAPVLNTLTLLNNVTRWPVLQKVLGCTHKVLPMLVNIGFQDLFHSPSGVLFTFPSRYYSLSVTREYLVLGDGPPGFPQGFTCPVVLWYIIMSFYLSSTGLSPSTVCLPMQFD